MLQIFSYSKVEQSYYLSKQMATPSILTIVLLSSCFITTALSEKDPDALSRVLSRNFIATAEKAILQELVEGEEIATKLLMLEPL